MTEYEEMLVAAGMISEADCDVEYQEYLRTFKRARHTLTGAFIAGKVPYNYKQWNERKAYANEVIASEGKHPNIASNLWGANDIWADHIVRRSGGRYWFTFIGGEK